MGLLTQAILSTTEMGFKLGWLRIELLLYCQLALITGSRPKALLDLRYRHLELRLVRDSNLGRPRLLANITPEFTKQSMGPKKP
jgi:hypothetical protein